MRASGASELRRFWHFYIIKVLFRSIWMRKNNHLQINILKHILRMHKHDFVGSKVFTHARYWQIKKICMHDFFLWGAPGGGTENLWGARAPPPPQAPRIYAPDWCGHLVAIYMVYVAIMGYQCCIRDLKDRERDETCLSESVTRLRLSLPRSRSSLPRTRYLETKTETETSKFETEIETKTLKTGSRDHLETET